MTWIILFYLFGCIGTFAILDDETSDADGKYQRLCNVAVAAMWPAMMVGIGMLIVSIAIASGIEIAWEWLLDSDTLNT